VVKGFVGTGPGSMDRDTCAAAPRRVLVAGLGVVAPGSAHWKGFLKNVADGRSTLEAAGQLSSAFMVGNPDFDFASCKEWISSHSSPARYIQLAEKAGENVRLSIGSVIQALSSSPGLESLVKALDTRTLILCGNAFGDMPSVFEGKDSFDAAQRDWNHFWAQEVRNPLLREWLVTGHITVDGQLVVPADVPMRPDPAIQGLFRQYEQQLVWDAYWAARNPDQLALLQELERIESRGVGENVDVDKLNVIRSKARAKRELFQRLGCPEPPWEKVNPRLLWNLPNAAAAQLSMLLGTHGPAYGMYGACATFGLLLHRGLQAIRSGEADCVLVVTADNTPPSALVAGFYGARVLAGGARVSYPLTDMRGTHVSGGACAWILAAEDVLSSYGVDHFGIEVAGVGLSSDAEHIITPSINGPKEAIRASIVDAQLLDPGSSGPFRFDLWDMHATGTPGDRNELGLIEEFIDPDTVVSARKGLFGHGMGSCGGWELTALAFSPERSSSGFSVWPSGIPANQVHVSISSRPIRIALDQPVQISGTHPSVLTCGKLSMGIGGISSCVVIRVDVDKRSERSLSG
jgi:3-oxoacyl-[acyl-carrier-protein] synthase II